MIEWIGIGAATFVGGGALWLIKRRTSRVDNAIKATMPKTVCKTWMAMHAQQFKGMGERLNRMDNRLETIRQLQERTLLEVRRSNGHGGG